MADEFTPTQKMAAAARKGLKLREQFNRGGTEVGVARAHQLAERKPLDRDDIVAMSSYFARHEVDKQGHSHEWGNDEDPSAGYVAWLLWGGEDGKTWADAKKKTLED